MKDVFKCVNELSRNKQYSAVLDALLGLKGTSIGFPYNSDKNHAWYLVGDAYYRQENFQLAISAFKKAIENWKDDKDAFLALSNCYSEYGLPDKSEEVLRLGLIKWPDEEQFIYNLGNALFDQEMHAECIFQYMRVVKNPEFGLLAKKNIRAAKKSQKNQGGKNRRGQ